MRQGPYSGQGAYLIFGETTNCSTNNNRINCHSNKLLKVHKRIFILAVTNIHVRYDENLGVSSIRRRLDKEEWGHLLE